MQRVINFSGGRTSAYMTILEYQEREFKSAEEMADAYNEKFKFEEENPEHEIKYVRVIVKRKK